MLARLLEVQPADITLPNDERPPFRGLLAFETEDAALFGGREVATREVVGRLQDQQMVALIGASGSGKSSVVKAGVIAQLQLDRSEGWRVLPLRPGADPLLALARALGTELDRDADENDRIIRARKCAGSLLREEAPLSDYLTRIAELRTQSGKPARVLLFVDQWEELYTQAELGERRRIFLDHLLEAFAGKTPHRLVLTMRADFMGHLLDGHRPFFDAVESGILNLPRMKRAELEEAIRKPAQSVGLKIDDSLVKAILDDAGDEPGMLALVEFTLTQLWDQRDKEANCLTLDGYHALGRLEGALDRHADAVYRRLSPEQQSAARRALMKLVHVSTLVTYTRTVRPLSDMDDEAERSILRALADQDNRLVVISRDEGLKEDVAEVSHEALIREWRRLHEWVVADPKFLQWREEVGRRRRRYDDNGRRPEDLLQGYDLEEAKSWLVTKGGSAQDDGDIPQVTRAFIQASAEREARAAKKQRDDRAERLRLVAEQQKLVAERQREEAERLAERTRAESERLRLVAARQEEEAARITERTRAAKRLRTFAFVGVLLMSVLAAFAMERYVAANRERERVLAMQSRFMAQAAKNALERGDYGTALALAVEIMPRNVATMDRPYVVEAERALQDIIRHNAKELTLLRGHGGPVRSAVFSADGARVLTASEDGTARLWEAASGKELAVLRGHGGPVRSAVFSADGVRVLTVSWDKTARLWEAASGKELAVLRGHEHFVQNAVFSPDGARVLTASYDNTARLWEAASGKELAVLRGHEHIVQNAVFSPDGARVLTASYDNTARLWEAASGKELAVLRGHEHIVQSAVFSPDGERVLTASYDKTARLWEAASGKELAVLRGHERAVSSAVFSADGARVLTSSADYTARLWEVASAKEQAVLRGREGHVYSAVFSPDGARVLTASLDGTARLWEAASGRELAVLRGHEGWVNSAVFSPEGAQVLTASEDGTARLWNAANGTDPAVLRGHEFGVLSAVFSADGARVLTASHDKTARLWEAASGKELVALRGHEGVVLSAVFSADSARVLTASEDKTARLWEAASGKELAVLRGHEHQVWRAVFSADGGRVLTASEDKTARLWEAASGKELAVLRGHEGPVESAVFSADGARVLTASGDGTARLWEAASGKELVVLRGHGSGLWSAVFSADSARVLTASRDNTARLWEAASGKELAVLRGHKSSVNSAVFFADGGRVLTASEDKTARLWEAASGKELAVLRGHEHQVWRAVFSVDGARVLTASFDGTARQWEAASGKELAVLRGHEGWVAGAVFSPDGAQVLTASLDGTARLWRNYATTQQLIDDACLILARPLSRVQRRQFFLEDELRNWPCGWNPDMKEKPRYSSKVAR